MVNSSGRLRRVLLYFSLNMLVQLSSGLETLIFWTLIYVHTCTLLIGARIEGSNEINNIGLDKQKISV